MGNLTVGSGKTYSTIAAARAAWTTGDVILLDYNYDGGGGTASLSLTAYSTLPSLIPIYTVNGSTYTKGTSGAPNIAITDTNADLVLGGGHYYGLYIKVNDDLNISTSGRSLILEDATLSFGGLSSSIACLANAADTAVLFKHVDITSYQTHEFNLSTNGESDFCMEGGSITVVAESVGLIGGVSGYPTHATFTGVDFGNTTFGSAPLVDMSASSDSVACYKFIQCQLPSGLSITDGVFENDQQEVELIGCDSAGDSDWYEKHTYRGTITPSTSVYRTAGSSLARSDAFQPSSAHKDGAILTGRMYYANVDSTGSKTITVYTADNLTGGAPNKNQAYLEVFYLGTTGETNITIGTSRPADLLATTALDTTSGLWTGAPTRQHKLTATVTVNKTGLIGARVVLGGNRDYSGDTSDNFWVDPMMEIS
jgi:hypothetical protein